MKIKYNRFAILPYTCSECQKTFWLELYKHYTVDRFSWAGCVTYITNICKECNKVLGQMEDTQENEE